MRGAGLLGVVETWGASSLPQWWATGLALQPQGSLRKSQAGLPPEQAAGQRPRSKGNGTLSPFLCHWFDRGRGGCFHREFEPCSLKSPSPGIVGEKTQGTGGGRQHLPAASAMGSCVFGIHSQPWLGVVES